MTARDLPSIMRRLLLPILLVVTVLLWQSDPKRAAFAYLSAYVTWFSVFCGSLLWLMIAHACRMRFFVVLRRFSEKTLASGPLLIPLFLPLVLARSLLYPWVEQRKGLSHHIVELTQHKLAWFSPGSFALRSLLYITVIVAFSEMLLALSRRQDARLPHVETQMIRTSVLGIICVSLALTFASFDWVMSLDPLFYSTVFGVYLFAGAMLGSLAVLCIGAANAVRRPWTITGVTAEHLHALGRLEMTFVCFWAYIAFSQGLLVWIADLPEEVRWYIARTNGGWEVWLKILIFCHFVLPFFLLLGQKAKRTPWALQVISIWLLVVHAMDIHFLVIPAVRPWDFDLQLSDLIFSLTVALVLFDVARLRTKQWSNRPEGDPLLAESLAYRSQT